MNHEPNIPIHRNCRCVVSLLAERAKYIAKREFQIVSLMQMGNFSEDTARILIDDYGYDMAFKLVAEGVIDYSYTTVDACVESMERQMRKFNSPQPGAVYMNEQEKKTRYGSLQSSTRTTQHTETTYRLTREKENTQAQCKVVITAGEYANYGIDATLGVPSMDWLREKMAEYKALHERIEQDDRWFGCLEERLKWVPDEILATDGWGLKTFDKWLIDKYGDDIDPEPGIEIFHIE